MPDSKPDAPSPLCLFDKRRYKILHVSVQNPSAENDEGANTKKFTHFSESADDIRSLVLLYDGDLGALKSTDIQIDMRPPEDDTIFDWSRFPEVHVPSVSNARPRSCRTIQAQLRVRLTEDAARAKHHAKKIRLNEGNFSSEDIGLPVLAPNGALKGLIVYVGKTEAIVAPFVGNRPDLTVATQEKLKALIDGLREQTFLKTLEHRSKQSEDKRVENGNALREEFASAKPNAKLSVQKYLKEFLR